MLIGEIRDKETATIAIEAALTGHLVLSSLHTNDAASAITRLVEMDVETVPGGLGDRLRGGPAPRAEAVRALQGGVRAGASRSCWRPGTPNGSGREIGELFRPAGCSACSNTGYRGRLGLYEVMPMTEEIERLTVERASSDQMKAMAVQQGMITLREDGLAKTRMGLTSIEEVARVVK